MPTSLLRLNQFISVKVSIFSFLSKGFLNLEKVVSVSVDFPKPTIKQIPPLSWLSNYAFYLDFSFIMPQWPRYLETPIFIFILEYLKLRF